MNEPLLIKYIHKPARSSSLINQTSLNLDLNKNSNYNKAMYITNENDRDEIEKSPTKQESDTESNSFSGDNSFEGDNYRYDRAFTEDGNNNPRTDYFGGSKLVRKKSGEILKSSLKDKFISKSLPSTPNSKQVHFGTDFDIKFFRKKDRPSALSANNSPTVQSPEFNSVGIDDDTDDTSDYSGDSDDDEFRHPQLLGGSTNYPNPKHHRLIDWKLNYVNFTECKCEEMMKENKPIFLERIFISIDKKYLLGHIAVKNLSFEKYVSLKYSFDNWNTIVEIPSIYVPDFPANMKLNHYDRFVFKLPLNNLFMSNSNSFYEENNFKFCLRYVAKNQELWDNNNFKNYEINLIKLIKNDPDPYNTTFNNFNFREALKNANPESINKPQRDTFSKNKPKYSNNYLKRVNSDSQLDIDYVKNNYYLSSPLLSSFNNQHHNNSADTVTNVDTISNVNTPKIQDFSNFNNSDLGVPGTFNLTKNDSINSKSYKDLIDKYCFFNSNKKDETLSVLSLLGI